MTDGSKRPAANESQQDDLLSRSPLAELVPFLLQRVVATAVTATAEDYRPLGLNYQGSRVLSTLLSLGEMKAGELAEFTSIDPSTLSHLLKRLERLGYIQRNRPTEDNRSVCVSLAKEGKQPAMRCAELAKKHQSILVDGINDADLATTRQVLKTMYRNAGNL